MSKQFTANEVKDQGSVDKGLHIIIDNNVYKLDGFVDEHPGGAKILKRVGGKDASKQFWKVGTRPRAYDSAIWKRELLTWIPVPQRERTQEVWTKAPGRNTEGGREAIDNEYTIPTIYYSRFSLALPQRLSIFPFETRRHCIHDYKLQTWV